MDSFGGPVPGFMQATCYGLSHMRCPLAPRFLPEEYWRLNDGFLPVCMRIML
jgi:hypothetical protein